MIYFLSHVQPRIPFFLFLFISSATTKAYKDKMKEATSYLAEAKELQDKLDSYYLEAMNFAKLEEIQQSLLGELEKFINK